jgi:hypothetical protein
MEEKNVVKIDNDPDSVDLSKVGKKVKKNPWIISTVVLAIVAIVLLVVNFSSGGITGAFSGVQMSGDDAGEKLVEFLNTRTGGGVEYQGFEDLGNLYQVNVEYENQQLPVYITKDGEYFVQGAIPMEGQPLIPPEDGQQPTQQQQPPPQNAPKSDKPKVELFIWSYCPYGVQAQGPLVDVASLLGDNADFEAVLYYDGHGAYETQQNKIQACIQKVDEDKYWQYAAGFVEDIYSKCGPSRDIECDKTESVKLMKSLGIDDSEVMSCVDDEGEDLIAEHSARAREYGVTGSPSLVINGVKVNTARNAEAFKTAVCGAFNSAPSDCSTVLDSGSAAPAAGNC